MESLSGYKLRQAQVISGCPFRHIHLDEIPLIYRNEPENSVSTVNNLMLWLFSSGSEFLWRFGQKILCAPGNSVLPATANRHTQPCAVRWDTREGVLCDVILKVILFVVPVLPHSFQNIVDIPYVSSGVLSIYHIEYRMHVWWFR